MLSSCAAVMLCASDVLVVCCSAILIYFVTSAIYLYFCGPLRGLPGPVWSTFTSLPELYHVLSENRAFWIHNLHHKYGSAVRIGPNAVSVTGVDAIKKIHGIGSKPYDKWTGYTKFIQILGPNVDAAASINGSVENTRRRKIYAPHFARQSLLRLSDRISNCVTRTGIRIERQRMESSDSVVDILQEMRRTTLDIIVEVAYGGCWKGKETDFMNILGKIGYCQFLRTIAPPLYEILLRIPLKSLAWVHSARIACKLSHDSIDSYIQNHLSGDEKPKEPLTDILLSPDPETGVPLPRPVQELEAIIMLLAGVDTSSDTAALSAWEIAKHPKVAEKLQKELDDILPDVSVDSVLEIPDVEKSPWLTACLKEALRIHPAVPGPMPRVVPIGGACLAGFDLPQDTVVFVQPYTAHRDPVIFPSPEAFKPERWLNESQEMRTSFVAFSQGPRLCLGYNLAWMELRLTIAFLFRNYNVSPAPGVTIEVKDGFTLHPKSGDCFLLLKRRTK